MGVGSFVKNNWRDIVSGGAAVYGAVKGNQAQNQANAMGDRQMAQAEREYNEAAPLRDRGMAGMLDQRNPYNMEGVGFDQTNPFARDRGQRSLERRPVAPMAATGAPTDPNGAPMTNPWQPTTRTQGGFGSNLPDAPQGNRPVSNYDGPTMYPTSRNTVFDQATGRWRPA